MAALAASHSAVRSGASVAGRRPMKPHHDWFQSDIVPPLCPGLNAWWNQNMDESPGSTSHATPVATANVTQARTAAPRSLARTR